MHFRRIITLFYLFCLLYSPMIKLSAQRIYVEGQIIDSISNDSVAFVHIYNESARKGYIANKTGYFKIPVTSSDTLIFSALGYFGKFICLKDKNLKDTLQISLQPRSYKIDMVSINRPLSYKEFKKEFLDVKIEKQEIQGIPKGKPIDIPILLDTAILNSDEFMVLHPISYLYYKFNKEEQSKRKVFYMERQQGEKVVISKKYNREKVSEITGLKNGELTNFIGYCNFSHSFLLEASELEIIQKIHEKLGEFQNNMKDP